MIINLTTLLLLVHLAFQTLRLVREVNFLICLSTDLYGGSHTPSGKIILGGTDYGFDSSIKSILDNATKNSEGYNKKFKAGEVHNFKCEGKVITKDESLEYKDRFLYFSLK